MDIYSLYKEGRWGYFHITSMPFKCLEDAKEYYRKQFGYNEISIPKKYGVIKFKIIIENGNTNEGTA